MPTVRRGFPAGIVAEEAGIAMLDALSQQIAPAWKPLIRPATHWTRRTDAAN
jgi:hypothetical protein